MPRNSSGDYSLPSGATATTGTTISSTSHNSTLNDLASAMTGSLARDGTGGMLADLAMGDNEITGLAAPTADDHAATKKYVDDSSASITAIPTGAVIPFAGGSPAPDGWLFCFGQAISRATYSALFALCSTTYGAGDGSTTFNLPDLRGRVVAGLDNMGGTSANRLTGQSGGVNGDFIGGTGGAETVTLTQAQLPAIKPAISITDPGHSHSYEKVNVDSNAGVSGNNYGRSATTSQTDAATTGITAAFAANLGSGAAHNNVQPTFILCYIIKT